MRPQNATPQEKAAFVHNHALFGFRRGVPIGYTHRRCLWPLEAFDRQCYGRSRQTLIGAVVSWGGAVLPATASG
jgi:hypothetical protein